MENGIASAASVASSTVTGPENVKFDFGAMAMDRLDIASLLAFYGLAGSSAGSTEMKQIYADFTFEGGTLTGTGFSCEIGAAHAEGFSARALRQGWPEIYALTAEAEAAEKAGTKVSPETVRKLVDFYTDLLTAFSTRPMQLDGVDCSGTDEAGKPAKFAFGAFTAAGFEPGIYPEFSLDDLDITVANDGYIRLGNFTWKRMDFNAAIEALRAATTLDEEWFAANWRKILPAMEGLSVTDLEVDVPDSGKPGERTQASLAAFDATLGQYVNGMPADISLTLEGLVVPITEAMTESPAPELLARGITEVTLGLATKLRWDRPSSTIVVENLLLDAGDLGLIAVSGTLGNATEALFADDPDAAMTSAQMLTIKDITIRIVDHGVGQLLVANGAKEAGQSEEAFRTGLTGMAQGLALAYLGNSEEALKAALALGTFLGGTASDLRLTITAKDPAGIGLPDIAAAENNPSALAGKLSVTAEASGEPVTLPEPVAPENDTSVQDEKRGLKSY